MSVKARDLAAFAEKAFDEKWGYIWATSGSEWTAANQAALVRKYQSDPAKYHDYKLGAESGSRWIGHRVTDCSGLPYRFYKDHGITIYHGSNSIWKYNLSHKGAITKGMKLPIGAAILTGTANDHPHIGILTSETTVTEAKGTLTGVVHTLLSNKKWTYWGLFKNTEYDFIPGEEIKPVEPAAPAAPTTPEPAKPAEPVQPPKKYATLKKGYKGSDVQYMQTLLMKAGEPLPKYGADGDFGSETLKAVKDFQQKHGLVVDGIVGKNTWAELINYA